MKPTTPDEQEEAQRERALQAWELALLERPSGTALSAARRILRIKRLEAASFTASLPGVVRRGARCDLAPLESALREAGIACEVRPSSGR